MLGSIIFYKVILFGIDNLSMEVADGVGGTKDFFMDAIQNALR